jgi:hypothetical protein
MLRLALFINETCPKCRKPTTQVVIDPHLTRHDLALQNFACVECGAVKTKPFAKAWRSTA